jgi:hypothetical protein
MTLIDERRAAEALGMSVQTLRNNRSQGVGVPYFKFRRSVRYCQEDLEQYIARHRVETAPVRESGR